MNRIVGSCASGWGQAWVLVDGEPLDPAPSLAIRNHSPSGFSWGYGGSGPAQLALAILMSVLGDAGVDEQWCGGDAERLYQQFKSEFLAGLRDSDGPLAEFELEIDIEAWAARQKAAA